MKFLKSLTASPCQLITPSTASLRASVTLSKLPQVPCKVDRLVNATRPSAITSNTIAPMPKCSRVSIFICLSMCYSWTPGGMHATR